MENVINRKNYDILDLTKFILSFFVVAIHSELLPQVLYPWLRVAVPLFFMITSFLFYSKLNTMEEKDKGKALTSYVKRNLRLYLIWFIILIPFTVLERKVWFENGIFEGILLSLRGLVFGSTFRASWFIMAGVISMVLVYLVRKLNNYVLFIMSFLLYAVCCLCTCYVGFAENTFLAPLLFVSKNVFGGIETSFVFALVFIVLGKMCAEKTLEFSRITAVVGTMASACLLYLEYYVATRYLSQDSSNSCYLMLIPISVFVFSLLISFDNLKLKGARFFRNSSTLIYVTHCAVLTTVNIVFKKLLHMNCPALSFLATSLIVVLLSCVLIKLSSVKGFKFLKKLW